MFHRLTTLLLLAALTLQAVFGGLQDSVLICLGGGHDHAAIQEVVVEATPCCGGCSHEGSWPAAQTVKEDHNDCGCTDLELALVTLLATPGTPDIDLPDGTMPIVMLPHSVARSASVWTSPAHPTKWDDRGGSVRHIVVRTTRLLI